MKNFVKEFKEFIAKGDVMSMAVGIIIGSAFTSIVNSLVNDVITPFLGVILGGIDFTGIVISFGGAKIMVGNFIQAVITFLLTALVIFSIMKLFNSFARKKEAKEDDPANAGVSEPESTAIEADAIKSDTAAHAKTVKLLSEIRDLLKKQEC